MTLPSTNPSPAAPSTSPRRLAIKRSISRFALIIGTLACVILTALGVSALGGFFAGQKQRDIQATQTTTAEIEFQYGLGISDLQAGNYSLAAERLRWVVEHDSAYPGAAKALAQAEKGVSQIAPTNAATLPPSSSQDPEVLFTEAKGYYDRQEWANAISRFQELQALDATYREVEVKEMLYTSLTTLGLVYIRGDRIEEGLFLLKQAEEIHPLDPQTAGERDLATLYSTGQTYWNLNWPVVINNFEAIYVAAPNYRDVGDKLWQAYVTYGDQLAAIGGYCDAADQYAGALLIENDEAVRSKQREAADACAQPTPIRAATPTGGPTPTPGGSSGGGPTVDGATLTPTPGWNIP